MDEDVEKLEPCTPSVEMQNDAAVTEVCPKIKHRTMVTCECLNKRLMMSERG